jgi:hypothetical protein
MDWDLTVPDILEYFLQFGYTMLGKTEPSH